MRKQLEGSRAVAETVARCRPEVVAAYPISPQTHIVEALSALVKTGELTPCEFVNVESEFAAMSVAIGASAAGARAYTATASQGLLFMAEAVYNASGLGLPIVMTLANRAIGSPINIWNDHSDAMSQRDSGWVQLYADSNQEAVDLHVQAFRLAEEFELPVMVCMDGFGLTHAVEPIDVPAQSDVDAFLPAYAPRQSLDPDDPVTIGAMVGPDAFMEVRYLMHAKQQLALEAIPRIASDFTDAFGRETGGLIRTYRLDDAELAVVALGSVMGTVEDAVDELRAKGTRRAGCRCAASGRTRSRRCAPRLPGSAPSWCWRRRSRPARAASSAARCDSRSMAGARASSMWSPASTPPRRSSKARRCLSCGSCFGCDNCFGVCPDNTVIKLDPAGADAYAVDLDYCKGCGVCAEECPCGAIVMEPEEV
jgi:pyruvate ferredoxin oxidoreductase alpha subunit